MNHPGDGGVGKSTASAASTAEASREGDRDQSRAELAELTSRMRRLAGWQRRLLAAVRTADLLLLFHEFGLRDDDLVRAVPKLTHRTLRRYRASGLPSAKAALRWEQVDDLRSIIGFLLADGTYDEESIVSWLRSRQRDLDFRRPLDVLGEGQFEEVLRAAEHALAPATVPGPVLQTHVDGEGAEDRAKV